jgi:hypothetical protein
MKPIKTIHIMFNKTHRKVIFEKYRPNPNVAADYIISMFDDVILDLYEYPSGNTHFITFSSEDFIFGIWNLRQQKFYINFRIVYTTMRNLIVENRNRLIQAGAPTNNFEKVDVEIGKIIATAINAYTKRNVAKLVPFGLTFVNQYGSWIKESKYNNDIKRYNIFIKQVITSKENDTTRVIHRMKRPNLMRKTGDDIILHEGNPYGHQEFNLNQGVLV